MIKPTGRIAALLAHPDDETFICGGSLAHFAKHGALVKVVSATRGEMGRRMGNPPFVTRESMPQVREQELRAACRYLGIEQPEFLGLRDKTVEFADDNQLVKSLYTFLRYYRPNTVLTFHPKWGGHPDHCAIGRATLDAVRAAADPGYPGDEPMRQPANVFFITFGDTMKSPERYGLASSDVFAVDVSDSLAEKLRAFRAHRTQTEMDEWLWKPDEEAIRMFGRYEYFINGNVEGSAN